MAQRRGLRKRKPRSTYEYGHAERVRRRNQWTKEADDDIRLNWRKAKKRDELYARVEKLGILVGYSTRAAKQAVQRRAMSLGVLEPWKDSEKALIRKHYRKKNGLTILLAYLGERRTKNEIKAFATKHLAPIEKKKPAWTPEENARLKLLWPELYSIRGLRAKFPGRTTVAIYLHATRDLKLKTGMPQGFISVQECARRFGYCWKVTEKVLREMGVQIHTYNRLVCKDAKHTAVDPFLAMEAFKAWTERRGQLRTVKSAADEIGVDPTTISRWIQVKKLDVVKSSTGYEIDPAHFEVLKAMKGTGKRVRL